MSFMYIHLNLHEYCLTIGVYVMTPSVKPSVNPFSNFRQRPLQRVSPKHVRTDSAGLFYAPVFMEWWAPCASCRHPYTCAFYQTLCLTTRLPFPLRNLSNQSLGVLASYNTIAQYYIMSHDMGVCVKYVLRTWLRKTCAESCAERSGGQVCETCAPGLGDGLVCQHVRRGVYGMASD